MKKSMFIIFLVSFVFVMGCSEPKLSMATDHLLYFEDDFSTDQHWLIAICEINWFDDSYPYNWDHCGWDSTTETYKIRGDHYSGSGIGFNMMYGSEWGDTLEFDFTIGEGNGLRLCENRMDIVDNGGDYIFIFNETGTYHYTTTIDRESIKSELLLPNGTIIYEEDVSYHNKAPEYLSGLYINSNSAQSNCDINFAIDNLKIYKKSDSNWGVIQGLIQKVNQLWSQVFGRLKMIEEPIGGQ
ncbi:hypothetical protein K8R33_02585 [archaeon]|nr:hypothetical protein [archaeon]